VLFIGLDRSHVEAHKRGSASPRGWTIEGAEQLLGTLNGVVSVRVVARPGGEIDEIHVLTTRELNPKQTVRNVESALLAQFDLSLDHRKISVAQTDQQSASGAAVIEAPVRLFQDESQDEGNRILFVGHRIESERSHRVRVRVSVEWNDGRFEGEATGADLPRPRLEALAEATLRSIETAIASEPEEDDSGPVVALSLDGIKVVDAFDKQFVLVAVHALHGREIVSLAGASAVDDSSDRSVILATLQATDRWIRGRA